MNLGEVKILYKKGLCLLLLITAVKMDDQCRHLDLNLPKQLYCNERGINYCIDCDLLKYLRNPYDPTLRFNDHCKTSYPVDPTVRPQNVRQCMSEDIRDLSKVPACSSLVSEIPIGGSIEYGWMSIGPLITLSRFNGWNISVGEGPNVPPWKVHEIEKQTVGRTHNFSGQSVLFRNWDGRTQALSCSDELLTWNETINGTDQPPPVIPISTVPTSGASDNGGSSRVVEITVGVIAGVALIVIIVVYCVRKKYLSSTPSDSPEEVPLSVSNGDKQVVNGSGPPSNHGESVLTANGTGPPPVDQRDIKITVDEDSTPTNDNYAQNNNAIETTSSAYNRNVNRGIFEDFGRYKPSIGNITCAVNACDLGHYILGELEKQAFVIKYDESMARPALIDERLFEFMKRDVTLWKIFFSVWLDLIGEDTPQNCISMIEKYNKSELVKSLSFLHRRHPDVVKVFHILEFSKHFTVCPVFCILYKDDGHISQCNACSQIFNEHCANCKLCTNGWYAQHKSSSPSSSGLTVDIPGSSTSNTECDV
ncbi:uncharacterized protein LOC141905424 isoform X2 [Tubulanus polymorphus]|uniref:uncharacterized protein LOC141905424 isoform X2 n=1 Tax=Tubulanus polymorphus TaxID=672921 RepID=UPI003DA5D4D6